MPSELARDLLEVLDQLSGGVHPGFRPVHAKGVMYSGTFTLLHRRRGEADQGARRRTSTPVTVQRFSGLS